jgi:ribulose-phosphate 3-epimerase
MSIIVPAILPKSRADLEDKLARIEGLAAEVQIDTVDGKFVAPETWPYKGRSWLDGSFYSETLPYLDTIRYEADLMVEDSVSAAGKWIDAGASRIVFHATSSQHLLDDIKSLQVRYGHDTTFTSSLLSFGLALNTTSDLALLPPFLPYINFVQFMGITRIGLQGEPFDKRIVERIRQCKKLYPKLAVQVDGGVSLETAPQLLTLGVERLVVGSALWKSADPKAEYLKLAALRERYGIFE